MKETTSQEQKFGIKTGSSLPKVSVVVPAYKMEAFLPQCLDSILAQTLEDIEVIIVDEGDLDECRAIINEYERKDCRIKTIHEKNGGYGASMNKGIALASGEYIGIVEADDYIDNKMFDDLYNLAKGNDADIVKSDFYYHTTAKNQSRKAGKIAKYKANKIINVKEDSSILRIQPSIWSAIYKRTFLLENDIRFLETKGGSYQDTSFAFKALSLAKRVLLTPKAYLHYRIDNENSSVNNKGKVYAICDEYKEIDDFIKKYPELKEFINSERLLNQYYAYVWNLKRIDEQFRGEFIEKFSEEFVEFHKNNDLSEKFYKKIGKNVVENLLNNKEDFSEHIGKLIVKDKVRNERNKSFSVRINSSRISIVLFGKQIIAKDF